MASPCLSGMPDISAPIFVFGEPPQLPASDAYIHSAIPQGALALTGPSATAEPGHLPVRGDLAHIKLAGRYFVPHYAAPMSHKVASAHAALRRAGKPGAEAIETLPQGEPFEVLDIAGGWAWGQHGEDGLVGYILLAELEAVQ